MPSKGKVPQAGTSELSRDARECFMKLFLLLSYVFDSLLFYLVDTFGSVKNFLCKI